MKIDRTRFLLLSTSLAAATAAAVLSTTGCQNTTTDTDAGTSTNVDDDSGTSTADGGAKDDDAGDASAAACLGNDSTKAPYCGPSGEGDPDAGDVDAGPAPKCPAGCSSFSNYFKTEVAKGLNDCLEAAPTCEGIESSCVDKVLAQACPDPAAVEFCTALGTTCGDAGAPDGDSGAPFTQDSCLQVANGLSEAGKAYVTSCTEGLPEDCGYCLWNVKNQAF